MWRLACTYGNGVKASVGAGPNNQASERRKLGQAQNLLLLTYYDAGDATTPG